MILIVGLGNPGANYANTRHNLGATWVTRLCSRHNVALQHSPKLNAKIASLNSNLYCMISNSYMNHSGFSVQKFCNYYKIAVEDVVVVHDDIDLEVGDLRLKMHGGHGGHNGLRHIIEQMQSNNFKRVRIGVGHPKIKDQVVDYVLEVPNKADKKMLDDAIENSWQKITQFLNLNIGDL